MVAQGQLRGPLASAVGAVAAGVGGVAVAAAADAEEQYAEVDTALAGSTVQAERTRAHRAYLAKVAEHDLHEVWEGGQLVAYRQAHADTEGQVHVYPLDRYPSFRRDLADLRVAALGY